LGNGVFLARKSLILLGPICVFLAFLALQVLDFVEAEMPQNAVF